MPPHPIRLPRLARPLPLSDAQALLWAHSPHPNPDVRAHLASFPPGEAIAGILREGSAAAGWARAAVASNPWCPDMEISGLAGRILGRSPIAVGVALLSTEGRALQGNRSAMAAPFVARAAEILLPGLAGIGAAGLKDPPGWLQDLCSNPSLPADMLAEASAMDAFRRYCLQNPRLPDDLREPAMRDERLCPDACDGLAGPSVDRFLALFPGRAGLVLARADLRGADPAALGDACGRFPLAGAANPTLPPDLMVSTLGRALAGTPGADAAMEALMSNPTLPAGVQEAALASIMEPPAHPRAPSARWECALARNRAIVPGVARAIFGAGRRPARDALAANPMTPPEILAELARAPEEAIADKAATNPALCDLGTMRAICLSRRHAPRLAMARHPLMVFHDLQRRLAASPVTAAAARANTTFALFGVLAPAGGRRPLPGPIFPAAAARDPGEEEEEEPLPAERGAGPAGPGAPAGPLAER